MSTPVDIINITAKTVKIHNGNGAGYKLTPFFKDQGTIQHTEVITLTNLALAASSSGANTGFKLTYDGQETTAFVVNVNATHAAIQSALRALTGGDTGAVVSGTADTGPFTVVYSDGYVPLSPITVTHGSKVEVATLTSFGGTDSFKLTYNSIETAAITRGGNYTAAGIQAILRTATSDTGLIVQTGAGFADTGFTVVYSAGFTPLSALTVTSPSGCTGVFASADVSGSVTDSRAAKPTIESVNLDALSAGGRRDLQLLVSSGSVIVGKTGTLDATAIVVTNIALGARARIEAKKLPARTSETVNLTALGKFGRRNLINLLAAGVIATGTAATCKVTNISSKVVRIGPTAIKPKRTNSTYASATINLTTITAAKRRDLQHLIAAGQVITTAA